MRKTLTTLAALAVGVLATLAAATACTPDQPGTTPAPVIDCPAEDSCEADYRDGAWWLRTYDDNSDTPPGPWVRVSR